MTLRKKFGILLTLFAFVLLQTQTAYADSCYLPVSPGESVEASNGDGTATHFVLDELAANQAEFNVDAQWWRTIYEAVRQEVKNLAPTKYNERDEDIILLLHNRPMDHLKIASLRFRLTDGQIVTAGQLDEARALRLAPKMFVEPDGERDYIVYGWYYWARNERFDIMALDCRDAGKTTIHELAHAFTIYDTSTEERESIARQVVESLSENEEFMALMRESSITPHLTAPTLVDFEDIA